MKVKRVNPTLTLIEFDNTKPASVVVMEGARPVAAFRREVAYILEGENMRTSTLRSLQVYFDGFPPQKVTQEWLDSFYKLGGLV